MPKRMRVVTSGNNSTPVATRPKMAAADPVSAPVQPRVVTSSDNPRFSNRLTENEMKVRMNRRYATSTTFGSLRSAADTIDSGTSSFYSPQLSTDFLEKPQNLKERRAFYRYFYNTNEIVGQAIDIHSTLPLSKIRLVSPKGQNPHQNEYVMKFFETMCEDMKLFKTLIEITFEYNLFGNCVSANTLVRTIKGYKKAQDIEIGDLVLTHENRWRSVLKKCSRESDSLLRIHTEMLPPIEITEEHPLEMVFTENSDQTQFIKAGEVKQGQYIRFIVPEDSCTCNSEDETEKALVEFEDSWRKSTSVLDKFLCCKGSLSLGDKISAALISKIEKIKGDSVYNFEVEEDHTYQVAGFSTHNCFIYSEDSDLDDMSPEERARKKEVSSQRTQFLKSKFNITDKDPSYKGWKKLIILPPDQVRIRKMPLTDEVAIEYVPDPQTKEYIVQGGYTSSDSNGQPKKVSMPADLQDKVRQSGIIPLDTDPYSGSYCFHLARKKSQYEPVGVSIIERCINTLVLLDKLRQAQTSIASRHMTPMRIVWAEDLSIDDVDGLREQVDMALVDPDYSIIANYEVHWEEMGSQGRLLDIGAENEAGLDRLMAGLGMTREILTGEGSYSGSKISLEIMNTQYLLFREVIQDYIENYLFKPIAKKKGFIEYDEYGNENIIYPRVSFTRLAIRDNDQFFDAAFQLYQKGSISIDLILDILNIDPISTKQKIENDLFTVNDSLFNELMRNIYTNVSAPLVEQTDVTDKIAKYLKLQKLEEAPEGDKRFSSDNQSILKEGKEKALKLAKIMRHFKDNPDLLEKVFENVTNRS